MDLIHFHPWSLKEISSELTIRGRYEEEAIVRCTSSVVDRYRREASTIEDYDRSMYIMYHRSMSRREMHDLVHAQQYQKQQGQTPAILKISCSLGTNDPQRPTFHIARRSSFHVDRFSHPTVDRHPTFIVDRSTSFDIDRYNTTYIDRSSVVKHGCDCYSQTGRELKPTSQIPAEPESLAEKKDEWEIAYINTKINDVYNPLNNNVDWLSTRIDLLQQDLDTIRKKDQQPATSIDICTITSIDSKFAAMEDKLQTYEDMHDRFTSPIMRYLDTLSTQMMNVQRDIGTLNDQHDFQEECSTSIVRFRRASLDVKKPTEHLPYTATEVDQITSKLYTAIDTMEDRFEKRCDDIYFPFNIRLCGLDTHAEWLQKEVKVIQRQFASQHQISASIDRERSKSIDSKAPASTDKHLDASIDTTSTPDAEQLIQNKMESMHEELNELSGYAYDKIG
ncbi:hypothetical protein F2Q70_00003718 [Brassica cretica]|uniref:Uncharacterized protein n=1 Tax=Brassica cretica TaxID=69181 RepID=A0A8S9J334_BRACR|nr:hypothetical protein F2Q70_00003718 [Brassica cretica]